MDSKFSLDSHKLHYHFDRIAEFQSRGDCYPIYMEVSPVGLCNHRCIFCAYDYINYPNRKLDSERYLSFLDEAVSLGVKSILYAGEGEPLLHPNIAEFIERTKEVGMDVGMFSNGELLNQQKTDKILPYLTFLRFSFNGGDAETYKRIHTPNTLRGGGLLMAKVLKNIAYAVTFREKNKLKVDLGAQFVLLQENKDSLMGAIKNLKECGVDYISIKPFVHQNQNQLYSNRKQLCKSEINSLIDQAKEYNSATFEVIFRENAFENMQQDRKYKHCYGCNFITTLNSAGEIASCLPYWDREEFVYGNIYKQTFYEIWNGEKRQKVKHFLENTLDCAKCPTNCRPNAINGFLSEILHPTLRHINFI